MTNIEPYFLEFDDEEIEETKKQKRRLKQIGGSDRQSIMEHIKKIKQELGITNEMCKTLFAFLTMSYTWKEQQTTFIDILDDLPFPLSTLIDLINDPNSKISNPIILINRGRNNYTEYNQETDRDCMIDSSYYSSTTNAIYIYPRR